MSAAPDLGKMVGPLPLGAWIAVVGGGLGFMFYTKRHTAPAVPSVVDPGVVDNTSGVPGVGTGSVGGWQATGPSAAYASPTASITTNEEWASAAVNWLIGQGYDAVVAASAVRKYTAGGEMLSVQEFTLIRLALVHLGTTPQQVPPGGNAPPSSVPGPVIPKTYLDHIYLALPSRTYYKVVANQKWRLSGRTVTAMYHAGTMHYWITTDLNMSKLPYKGDI